MCDKIQACLSQLTTSNQTIKNLIYAEQSSGLCEGSLYRRSPTPSVTALQQSHNGQMAEWENTESFKRNTITFAAQRAETETRELKNTKQ